MKCEPLLCLDKDISRTKNPHEHIKHLLYKFSPFFSNDFCVHFQDMHKLVRCGNFSWTLTQSLKTGLNFYSS
uniref:Uncharacterized protein n=1 Tax=Arundo donax TaxID=35708 RepID=A0A0A9EDS4_ARUDO